MDHNYENIFSLFIILLQEYMDGNMNEPWRENQLSVQNPFNPV